MKHKEIFFITLCLFLLITLQASAAGFKVYGYGTRKQGETELVYFNNYILQSDLSQNHFGEVVDREGHFSHSLEIEYGFTPRWTVSAYVDFEQPKGMAAKYTRMRGVFFRYRFFEKGDRFFDTAIYMEYYIPKKKYKNEEELEIKLILEKDMGKFRIDLNPSFEKALSGPEVAEGLKFNYASGFYLHVSSKFRAGLEFYGKMGELNSLKAYKDQRHWIFPSIKVKLPKHIGLDMGAGFGLTDYSDDLIIKGILSIEFD
jgi:hypothetical protein